jgi:hypothetical protein
MKKITYLGELTWHEAIDKATELGMDIPNYSLMNRIFEFIKNKEVKHGYTIVPSQFITSTTYKWNTSKFVLPVDKDIFELQNSDSVENSSKSIKRKAYAIEKGTTETDIDTLNFYFTD